MGALSNSFIKSFNSINMSNILKVFDYSRPYKNRVLNDGGSIDSDRLLKSLLLFFVQNNIDSNILFAWNEFCGAKDGKAYNLFSTNDLVGTQEYDRGMVLFNGSDQNATVDVSGYSTIAIAYRTGDEVIITNSLTGLGEISGNTLYLGSNAAETEFYSFDLLALVVLNTSAYQLVESYLEMVPIGSKLNLTYFNTRVFWKNTEPDPTVDVSAEMLNYFRQVKMVALNAAGQEVHTFATWDSPTVTGATDGSLGQVMAKLPKLYVKFEYDENGHITAYTLRSTPAAGFALHECFWDYDLMDGSKGRDYIYVGSYEGVRSGGKLQSISGVVSTGGLRMDQFRDLAQATFTDGNGHQLDFYTQELIQLLFYAYYGTRDSQTALPGYTERSVYNAADFRNNGRTDILTTVNGYVNAQTGAGEVDEDIAAGWKDEGRGTAIANRFLFIENIFGAKWKFLDGCSFDGRVGAKKTAWVHPDPRVFTSVDADILTNYIDLNVDLLSVATTSYIGGVGRGFIPLAALGADSAKYYCDLFYSYLSDAANRNYLRSVLAGGSLPVGSSAGLAARISNISLATSYTNYGSRLCYKKI